MDWHPGAIRQALPDAGPFTGGGRKLVWHTTEGSSYPGTSLYHGTCPHFTCDVKRRRLFQHVALSRAAKALEHPPGTGETNHDHAIQVELVGFAAQTGGWTDGDYAFIASLARFIEHNADVPRRAVTPWNRVRLSWPAWHSFSGHCGHMHVPANSHTDPGKSFQIGKVLDRLSKLERWRAELKHRRQQLKVATVEGTRLFLVRRINELKAAIRRKR